MAYNENQLFYSAMWWLNGLPGGGDHCAQICARYGKPEIEFPAYIPKRVVKTWNNLGPAEQEAFRKANPKPYDADEDARINRQIEELIEDRDLSAMRDEITHMFRELEQSSYYFELFNKHAAGTSENPLPSEVLDRFFDAVYEDLVEGKYRDATTSNGLGKYMELGHSPSTSSLLPMFPEHPYDEPLESAMHEAGIERGQMPQKTMIYLHEDGQVFVPQTKGDAVSLVALDYPGKPDLPYAHVDLKPQDMDHCPTLTWTEEYRVVPLAEGQAYKTGYKSISGKREEFERIAGKGEALVVYRSDVDDKALLRVLTDQDIIAFAPDLKGSFNARLQEFTPGYRHPRGLNRIEESGEAGIVLGITENVRYMEVKGKPVQIGKTSNYSVAKPGDFIIREHEGWAPRVIRREAYDSGRLNWSFDGAAPKPVAKGPRLH